MQAPTGWPDSLLLLARKEHVEGWPSQAVMWRLGTLRPPRPPGGSELWELNGRAEAGLNWEREERRREQEPGVSQRLGHVLWRNIPGSFPWKRLFRGPPCHLLFTGLPTRLCRGGPQGQGEARPVTLPATDQPVRLGLPLHGQLPRRAEQFSGMASCSQVNSRCVQLDLACPRAWNN